MHTHAMTLGALCATMLAAAPALACDPAPAPVITLDYGSRYQDGDASRSTIDKEANAAVNAALKPIDDFIRNLVRDANTVASGKGGPDLADCIIGQMATWAAAGALTELDSLGANFSVGSRWAGFAFVHRLVRPHTRRFADAAIVEEWLRQGVTKQVTFWEEDATEGAKRGNLRGWATLSINLVGEMTGDDVLLRWSAASATFLQCQARDDGSLPQETKRGKYALHYQLHAVAPLVVTTALLEEQGLSIRGVCDNALDRIVAFTLRDLTTGEATKAYSGKVQTFFDGSAELKPHNLAWIPAYLSLNPTAEIPEFAMAYAPFGHSKLGGDQDLIWPVLGN